MSGGTGTGWAEEKVIKHKVESKKYFEALDYIHGVKRLGETEYNGNNTFTGVEGAISFIKFPASEYGHVIYGENLRLSEEEKLNRLLIKGLEDKLNN